MRYNKKMSEMYGLHIYNSKNWQFPYYVDEWGECFTEEEIRINSKDYFDFANINTEDE